MELKRVDVAVIGAGTAGLSARRQAQEEGASRVLIESGPYGTMCARVGCMPSKLLIAAADRVHEVRSAAPFGIRVPAGVEVDGPAVMERVRRERDRFAGFVVDDTEALPEVERLRGRARFVGPATLEVGDHTRVEARAVVVATGSAPAIPAELEPVRDRALVNDDVFDLDELPESVAVIGTGVIGLELGQALHRLGVRTTLFARSERLGPLTDPALQEAARTVFGGELDLVLGARLEAGRSPEGVRLTWSTRDGKRGEGEYARVLAAAGRHPVVSDLGLERAGVELDARGVPGFDPRTMQCGDTPVFIAGDVTGERPLLHEAADEGRIAGYNAAHFPEVRAHHRRVPLAVVFSDPQVGLVGARHADLEPGTFEVGEVDYGDQGRARVMGKNAGLVRVYGRISDGRLLGAELLGPRVEHTAHLLAWAIQPGIDVEQALQLPFYHPVVEEGLRTALRDLARKLRLTGPPCARDLDCGPGA